MSMKRNELARRLAQQKGLAPADAADQLDTIVHDILTGLRQGRRVSLPGLGTFLPRGQFRFERRPPAGRRGGGK